MRRTLASPPAGALTAAQPKVGAFPFTTTSPNLGVLELDEERTAVIADVPGLIEGANEGHGLGHAFLRHVERTRVLVAVVDGAADDPVAQWRAVAEELRLHDPALMRRPMPMAVTKQDLPEALAQWPAVAKALRADGGEPIAVSAHDGSGLDALRAALDEALAAAAAAEAAHPAEAPVGCTDSTRSTRAGRSSPKRRVPRAGPPDRGRGGSDRLQERRVARPLPAHARADGHRRRAAPAGGGPGTMVRIGRVELEWGEDE